MKIAVIGSGYVGLVTGVCFADAGHEVTCIDIDAQKVAAMQQGKTPIYEPGLAALMKRNLANGRLGFTTELKEGISGASVIFFALPTPQGKDGAADLSAIQAVANALGPHLTKYVVIVDKSTVPVGTTRLVHEAIAANTSVPFDVVSNPEFLREGYAIEDFAHPDRIVVGSSSERARQVMTELYESFAGEDRPLLFMDEASAEMAKYAANSFLVTKISFMNEIANLCEHVGADVDAVREAIGSDSRIGGRFLFPGIGYGGSCFPKDIRALQNTAESHGYHLSIVEAVMNINQQQQRKLIEKLVAHYGGDLVGKTFALWGLSFKPNTDDIREASSIAIIEALLEAGARVRAFDPEANGPMRQRFAQEPDLTINDDQYDVLDQADALLVVTEWQVFRDADLQLVKSKLNEPLVFDGRNIYTLAAMEAAGFDYYSIGRRPVFAAQANAAPARNSAGKRPAARKPVHRAELTRQ